MKGRIGLYDSVWLSLATIVPPKRCSFFLSFQVTDMIHEKQPYAFFQMLPESITKHLITYEKGVITLRLLEFNVNKQRLIKRPGCDFRGLVAGSIGYLKATFDLSEDEWKKCTDKVARFWIDEQEHAERLDDTGSCVIPPAVLTGSKFKVSVLGVAPGYRIETNDVTVRQEVR